MPLPAFGVSREIFFNLGSFIAAGRVSRDIKLFDHYDAAMLYHCALTNTYIASGPSVSSETKNFEWAWPMYMDYSYVKEPANLSTKSNKQSSMLRPRFNSNSIFRFGTGSWLFDAAVAC